LLLPLEALQLVFALPPEVASRLLPEDAQVV
jgi:hypothetical protein